MSTYELTILFAVGEDKEKTRIGKVVEDFVKKTKGELMKKDEWGVKELSYPIASSTQADFVHYVLQLTPDKQPQLDKSLRLDEAIKRYLFVKVG